MLTKCLNANLDLDILRLPRFTNPWHYEKTKSANIALYLAQLYPRNPTSDIATKDPRMVQKVWRREFPAGHGLEKALAAARNPSQPHPISDPPSELGELANADVGGEGFTLSSFTAHDAVELGHLLYARLLPFTAAQGRPALISICGAGGAQVLFQMATGPGTTPDNESWVRRKRAAALRFGVSSWYLGRKHRGDEAAFAAKFGLGPSEAGQYAIHGGAVPIRVEGVEGVVGVVVVSGLKQGEDHGVIAEVIRENWE
ncbi:UPF0303 protein [Escovopsis weberi]|uniref:UPF0303 protein n=1 Tax=Escovopsis weberi TaxID=150374 RepID=A0A0M8N8H9_ESCWE|nr:UPF0303 protein [Escovopsis weberi]